MTDVTQPAATHALRVPARATVRQETESPLDTYVIEVEPGDYPVETGRDKYGSTYYFVRLTGRVVCDQSINRIGSNYSTRVRPTGGHGEINVYVRDYEMLPSYRWTLAAGGRVVEVAA